MLPIGLWWRALRPFAFSASVVSALLGGLVAVAHGGVRLHLFHYVLAALGAACAHAGANLMNDFFDHRKGVDREDTLGSSGVIRDGLMKPRAVLIQSFALWILSALFGVYFLLAVGPVLWPLLAAGLLLGAGYTAAPTELKYRALGDLAVFVAFGVGITLGSYAVQTGHLSWIPVAYGIPISFLVAAILHGNNLRDMESDRQASIRTLAMLLGRRRGWDFYLGLVVLAYASLVVFVISGVIVPWSLIALVSLPLALQVVRQFGPLVRAAPGGPATQPAGAPAATALAMIDVASARLHMAFGVLLIVGVLLRILI